MNLLITGAWSEGQKYVPELEALGHRVAFLQQEKEALPYGYDGVEGVICNGLFLYHDIRRFTALRYIQLTSAGFDRVDMEYVRAHGIEIHNAGGVYSVPMAEFTVAGVLALYKRLFTFHEQQRRHEWTKLREIRELCGKRILIVGCGDVGRECAARFRAFGCRVIGVNRTVREIDGFDSLVGLSELDAELERADVVIVAIALCGDTKGLVKARLLRPDAVLVNISRGGTVDLADSQCELILDVFDQEPLKEDSELWESAIVTPHNSFVGGGNESRLHELILYNLRMF